MIYPWQKLQWQHWIEAVQSQRIPHAILLTGMTGLGKLSFALQMTRSLFCKNFILNNEITQHCTCHPCQLIAANTHPNICRIPADNTSQIIKIDEIRTACDFIAQTAVQDNYRLVIIESAHNMNHYAANALLKTLEEPASHGLIILVTDQEGALLQTVRSRCRRIVFSKPNQESAMTWLNAHLKTSADSNFLLKLSGGAPLKALALADDEQLVIRKNLYETLTLLIQNQTNPVEAANKLHKNEILSMLDHFIIWIKDLMHLKLNTGQQQIISQDFLSILSETSHLLFLQPLSKVFYEATYLREQIQRGINLNKQLLMETLFFRFQECLSCN